MTDLEISKALALAIGWREDHVWATSERGVLVHPNDGCKVRVNGLWQLGWRIFDYRDWNVIGPIAERYECFPERGYNPTGWGSWCEEPNPFGSGWQDTPQKAIALAVIGAKK